MAEDEEFIDQEEQQVEDLLADLEEGDGAAFDEVDIATFAGEAAEGEEHEGDDDNDGDEPEVQEHLKDAVEGSLRLKRLLNRDEGNMPANKKRKKLDGDGPRPIEQAKVKQLLTKWTLQTDAVVKHVLENLSLVELKTLVDTNYVPDKFNMWKSPAELLAKYVCEVRERKTMAGGGPLDSVSTFKFKWKLDAGQDKLLRSLNHQALRYVLAEYDGTQPLEDLISDAAHSMSDENSTQNALPDAPGVGTIGRFQRLELIDPLADCAVFGDANLTFSLKLAKHRKALGHVGRVIATTFEELDTLRERYKEIDESIKILEDHYAEVYHGVDCTRIAIDPRLRVWRDHLGQCIIISHIPAQSKASLMDIHL